MPDEVATVQTEVKTIPPKKLDEDATLPGAIVGMPLPGEPGSIYARSDDIAHGLPLVQAANSVLVVDQQAANDAVNNNAPDEDAIAEAEEREAKRQGKTTSGDKKTPTKNTLGSTPVHKTQTEPGVKGIQVPSK